MIEVWKDIKGYEGEYKVSNLGRVKSLKYMNTRQEQLLSLCKDSYGYLQVGLWKLGKVKMFKVHRLVATTFIDNPDDLQSINHIDENKLNNCVENLEFCTIKYNNKYGSRLKRVSISQAKKVFQYDKNLNLIKIWESGQEAQRKGFSSGNISNCCNGKLNQYKGYIWSYTPLS